MTHDRNYLRMMHDRELTRYAADNVRTELEFVLLERLERLVDVDDELERAQMAVEDLQTEIAELKAEAAVLQASLDRTDAE